LKLGIQNERGKGGGVKNNTRIGNLLSTQFVTERGEKRPKKYRGGQCETDHGAWGGNGVGVLSEGGE